MQLKESGKGLNATSHKTQATERKDTQASQESSQTKVKGKGKGKPRIRSRRGNYSMDGSIEISGIGERIPLES